MWAAGFITKGDRNMYDLSVIGLEDGFLILAAEDGTKFRIAANELLPYADPATQPPVRDVLDGCGAASVKDIQALIREGLPAEKVAQKLSTSIERVKRFEPPVAAERSHMAQMALGVSFGDKSFGEILLSALEKKGVSEYKISAKKGFSAWVLGVEYVSDAEPHHATWDFNHKDMSLRPVDATARELVPEEICSETFDSFPKEMNFGALGSLSFDSENRTRAAENTPGFFSVNDVAVAREKEPLLDDSARDLVDALRKRHKESIEQQRVAKTDINQVANLIDIDSKRDARAADPERARQTSRRTSVPSWDEILFGSDKNKN